MKRLLKLLFLIMLSLSVYGIYNKTKNTTYVLTSIGDKLSLGVDSYGRKTSSYIDYYQEELLKTKENVKVIKEYEEETATIKETLERLKTTPEMKRELYETDILIITLGYNDLLYSLAREERKTKSTLQKEVEEIAKNYNELIEEIKKYYHEEIIVIGYFESNTDDYYKNKGITLLNEKIRKREDITYIDTTFLTKNRKKYFSNPKSYYPNEEGYLAIGNKIIQKTLEK